MASVLGGGVKNIQNLPENILLEIFTHLPTKELCAAGRVCRVWRRVVNDNSLWRHVDLSAYKLNLHKMWKVIRAHFSDVLLSVHLRGYMDRAVVNWNKPSISDAMLKELGDRCPNIRSLGFVMTSLGSVSASKLPPGLTQLSVTHSFMPPGWLRAPDGQAALLPALTHLDLTESTKTTNADAKDIARWTELKVLKLNGCYRVKEDGLVAVAKACSELTVLEIASTGATDSAVHHLARGLPKLTRLNLAGCRAINDGSMVTVAACLRHLQWVDVSGCKLLTEAGVSKLTASTVVSDQKTPPTA